MRAWQIREYGDVDTALRLVDVPEPTPGRAVHVRTQAAALGFADLLACAGQYQDRPALPWTGGLDAIAGVVVDRGANDELAIGDRVVGLPQPPDGGWGEVVAVPPHRAFPVAPEVDVTTAAAMFTGFHTARYALLERARLEDDDTVLVLAGASAVGSAAIQIAHNEEARVIATASTEAKRDACRQLGADVVLEPDQLAARVLDVTGGRGVDVAVDAVGGEQHVAALRCLAAEGRLLTLGFASGEIPSVKLNRLLLRNATVVGVYWGAIVDSAPERARTAHGHLMSLFADGTFRPYIQQEVSFSGIPEALKKLQARGVTGKLIARFAD